MTDSPRNVQLEQLLELVRDVVLDRVRAFEIGVVTAYDANQQSVTVQPVIARSRVLETGDVEVKPASRIANVPIWYFGADGARVTCPPVPGDYGLILFCGVSTERWKRRGGVVDPGDNRRHSESDAVFIPGMHPLTAPPTSAPASALVLHPPTGGVVKSGGDIGTQKTLMADSFLSALDDLVSAIAVAVGASGTPAGAAAAQADIETAAATFSASILRDAYKTTKTEVK